MHPMNPVREYVRKQFPDNGKRRKIPVFLLFVFLSSVLWLLIKLSDEYIYTLSIPITYKDLPGDVWMPEQTDDRLNLSVQSRGFVILKLKYLKRIGNLEISLDEVPWRKRSQTEYYIHTANLRAITADLLNISEGEIDFEDNETRLLVKPLQHKKVAVNSRISYHYASGYNSIDGPQLKPDSVFVYGPGEILDTLQFVHTKAVTLNEVKSHLRQKLPLIYDESRLRIEPKEIMLEIQAERFTESSFQLNIMVPEFDPRIKIFPEMTVVRFMLSVNDYSRTMPHDFRVILDTSTLHNRPDYLPLKLNQQPDWVKNVTINPDFVEYILVSQ